MLEKPTAGSVYFNGFQVDPGKNSKLKDYRGSVQAVFQDAGASLNPRLKVGVSIAEPLLNLSEKLSGSETAARVNRVLSQVGLDPHSAGRYPHEFSGGQQRRIALARALVADPDLIICDEATSGLDVSVQAQLLNLLLDLHREEEISYLFVSHDLAVVRYLCHNLLVMYGGRIVEELPSSDLACALHPYTLALAAAEPSLKTRTNSASQVGEPPDPAAYPQGCRFNPRCSVKKNICNKEYPPLIEVSGGHRLACWLYH